jgi:hypothetical protein
MNRKRKTLQTIRDPKLNPFFITVDDYCFTVKEMVIPDATHFKAKGERKEYERSLFYYPHLDMALLKIIELKNGTEDFNSLNDYLKQYQTITNNIKEYTHELRSII